MNAADATEKKVPERRPAGRLLRRLLLGAAVIAAAELAYRLYWLLPAAAEPADTFALYIVGESTAAGSPYESFFSPGELVSRMFGGRLEGRAISLRPLAAAGESVYPQYAAFERALRRARPRGAVLIYSGNNDHGARRGVPAALRAWQRLAAVSLLAADLQFAAEKYVPALRVRTLDTYAYYLRRLTETALEHGLKPVLFTVASNASGIDPGLRAQGALTSERIEAVLRPGRELERAGRQSEAAAAYLARTGDGPQLKPFLLFSAARCFRAAGDGRRAARLFDEAVAAGTGDNFSRATPEQNAVVRALAAEYRVQLADTDAVFRKNSPGGITGWELFTDGHHPAMRGYRLLAGAAADALSAATGTPVLRRYDSDAEVFREFGAGPVTRASSLVASGRWLLAVSALHASPELRLNAAEKAFSEAAALDPLSPSPRLGLALIAANGPCGLLSTEPGLAWMKEMDLVYGGDYLLAPEKLAAVGARLAACGVEATKLSGILAPIGLPGESTQTPARRCLSPGKGARKEVTLQACREASLAGGDEKTDEAVRDTVVKLLKELGRAEEAAEAELWR